LGAKAPHGREEDRNDTDQDQHRRSGAGPVQGRHQHEPRGDAAALDVGLSRLLVELVKIRVSQLNGCAFCLRWHTKDALAKGETTERLAVLPAWRETSYFDEVERGALGLAELVTQIGDSVVGERYDTAVAALTPDQVAAVAWVTIAINALNRVAITSHYTVEPSAVAQ